MKNAYALEWELDYLPGILKAVGYTKDKKVCENQLVTSGIAKRIELSSDCSTLKAGESDFAEISIWVVDENGIPVPDASNRITAKVNGCGSLLGVISADMTSNESYRSNSCNAYKGRCMAVVQAAK